MGNTVTERLRGRTSKMPPVNSSAGHFLRPHSLVSSFRQTDLMLRLVLGDFKSNGFRFDGTRFDGFCAVVTVGVLAVFTVSMLGCGGDCGGARALECEPQSEALDVVVGKSLSEGLLDTLEAACKVSDMSLQFERDVGASCGAGCVIAKFALESCVALDD
jgi:hypothetical protein